MVPATDRGEGNGVSDQAERTGLSIFDKAPTGGFQQQARGYNREQVERYVRKIEDRLGAAIARGDERGELLEKAEQRIAELSSEVSSLRSRLTDAENRLRNAEQPSFAGLGEHVAGLLKTAEEQSQMLVRTATADAERMRSEAAADAEKTRSEADAYAQQTRSDADGYDAATRGDADEYAGSVRAEADTDARAALDAAHEESTRLRHEANQDATSARVQAVEESKALLAEARQAAANVRAAAEKDADQQREAATTLLHESRRQSDHAVGAVTAALATIAERLRSTGVSGVLPPEGGVGSTGGSQADAPSGEGDAPTPPDAPTADSPDAEDTQFFPATPNSF